MLYQLAPDLKHRSEAFGGIAQSMNSALVFLDLDEYRLLLSFKDPRSIEDLSNEDKEAVAEFIEENLIIPCS